MAETFRRLARENVTVYPIDPCGLGGLESYALGVATRLPSLKSASTPLPAGYNWLAPDGPPPPLDLARHISTLNLDFLQAMAAGTGGRAIVNTNDFASGLDGLFEENSSYYLVGYASPPKRVVGSLHRVSVNVNRPGVTVRARSGYQSIRDAESAHEGTAKTIERATAGPVADGALPLHLAAAPVSFPGKAIAAVTIVVGLSQPPVTARTPERIELATSVFTPDGTRVGEPLRQTAAFTLVPGGDALRRYEVLTQVALPPGRYELRVGAHRASDGKSGSVYADIEVPDFDRAPLSLSGAWLEMDPGPSAVPSDAFARLIPIVPTSERDFFGDDRVTAFFRIYEGGAVPLAPVGLSVRIVNEADVEVVTAHGTIGVDRFNPADRAADHRFGMPVDRLAPGRYLLRVEASLNAATVRRDVMFRVR